MFYPCRKRHECQQMNTYHDEWPPYDGVISAYYPPCTNYGSLSLCLKDNASSREFTNGLERASDTIQPTSKTSVSAVTVAFVQYVVICHIIIYPGSTTSIFRRVKAPRNFSGSLMEKRNASGGFPHAFVLNVAPGYVIPEIGRVPRGGEDAIACCHHCDEMLSPGWYGNADETDETRQGHGCVWIPMNLRLVFIIHGYRSKLILRLPLPERRGTMKYANLALSYMLHGLSTDGPLSMVKQSYITCTSERNDYHNQGNLWNLLFSRENV